MRCLEKKLWQDKLQSRNVGNVARRFTDLVITRLVHCHVFFQEASENLASCKSQSKPSTILAAIQLRKVLKTDHSFISLTDINKILPLLNNIKCVYIPINIFYYYFNCNLGEQKPKLKINLYCCAIRICFGMCKVFLRKKSSLKRIECTSH